MNVLWIIFWSVYVCTHVSECICPSSPVGHVARLTDFLYKERVVSAYCYTRGSCEVSASGIMSVFYLPKILSILMIEMSTHYLLNFSEHFLISNLFNAFSVHIEGQFSSVQFSHSAVSDSLRPHGLQRARPPCPSPTPGVYSNSCPLSRWCHPTISSSVDSSCLQSFPASGTFQMSQLFTSGGQSIRVSASASVLQWTLRTDFL